MTSALRVAADLAEAEDVADGRDQNQRPQHAGELALAAENADAAEQHDRDDVELHARAHYWPAHWRAAR